MRATYLLDTVGPVRSRRGAHVELNKLSGTAVITGASSGIGAAYALELARRGLRPVLVARRQGLLEEVAARIHQVTGVTCEIWKADLSRRHQVEQAAAKLEAIPDLSMLVNNAGLGLVGKFDCTDAATHRHVGAARGGPTLLSVRFRNADARLWRHCVHGLGRRVLLVAGQRELLHHQSL